jgi:polysaccharide deacetylase family protein (PEP-CTERM system associated)
LAWAGNNIFSVDVEDYFHASALANGVRTVGKENLEHRVCGNTERILGLLEERGVEGTFFVLGWVAERYPKLVKNIHASGHEVACHGYSHSIVYEQAPDEFRQETKKAKSLLEDIIGESVHGYRAASFSITDRSLWALDVLAECGFSYDSSIFPVRHDRYGIPGADPVPHKLKLRNGMSIAEVPMSVAQYAGINVPVSGGGYFRLFPYWFSRFSAKRVNRAGRPWVFYLHPWEVDPDQPRLPVKGLSRFRHYNNLEKTDERLRQALSDFEFSSMRSCLRELGLLPHTSACEDSHTGAIANSR